MVRISMLVAVLPLIGVQIACADPPESVAARAQDSSLRQIDDAQVVTDLERFVKKLTKADRFSGSVPLAKDGNVLFKAAYGQASKRYDVPNRVDTKFNLGSMNKMFTGVAIAQLAQRGKLSLDDLLSKYLSTDWLPREVTDKIKIRHLLTHTSGLGSYFNEAFMNSSRALYRRVDDYRSLVAGDSLAFEPGTNWSYSNTGFLLLGAVIEKVSGQSYFDYVRENIYAPAGMTNTDCYEMDHPVENLAMGYSRSMSAQGTEWVNNLYQHVIKGGPAGGGFSTAEDLFKFAVALRSHKLLNPEYTEMVMTSKPELGSPDYGFGFGIRGSSGDRIVGHGGGFPGINSNLDMFVDSGYTAVVMSNYDRGAQPIMNKIRKLLNTQD